MNFSRFGLLASFVSLAPAAAQQFGSPELLTSPGYSVSGFPGLAFDVDQDGDLDLVQSGHIGQGLYWVEQVGLNSGQFGEVQSFGGTPDGFRSISSADLDGDGLQDLLLTMATVDKVFVFWGEVGGLSPEQEIHGGPRVPYAAEVADLDGDGDKDVLLPSTGGTTLPDRLSWIENLGARNFAAPAVFPLIDAEPIRTLVGDVDGDGHEDIVSYDSSEGLRFYRNTGTGFSPPQQLTGFSTSWAVSVPALVDFDLDGDLDLHLHLVPGSGTPRDYVARFRTTSSAFGSIEEVVGSPGRSYAIDVTGDHVPDLVGSMRGENRTFLRGLGGAQFGPAESMAPSSGRLQPNVIGVDLNGDGWQDLVSFGKGGMNWRAGAPPVNALALESGVRSILALLIAGNSTATTDLDGDGAQDILVATDTDGLVGLQGNGFGAFGAPEPVSPTLPLAVVTSVSGLDVDGDGLQDLVQLNSDQEFQWRRGLPGGGLAPAVTIASLGLTDRPPSFVDLDGDGDLDLLETSPNVSDVQWWEQEQAGAFAASAAVLSLPNTVNLVAHGDVDGDGRVDLVAGVLLNGSRTRIRWFQGLGGGQFATGESVVVLQGTLTKLACEDLDDDGAAEIYWCVGDPSPVEMARRDASTGMFTTPAVFAPWRADESLDAADLNGDGVTDLLLRRRSPGEVRFVPGTGAFTYGASQPVFDSVPDLISVELADADSDGDIDLIVAVERQENIYQSGTRLLLFRNQLVGQPGDSYCGPAEPNSTGRSAELSGSGSLGVADNSLSLRAANLPSGAATLFLTSRMAGFVMNPAGSAGNLCLGGSIGRFAAPGQVQVASGNGTAELAIDLTALPQPTGSVGGVAGETWHFQAWHRDAIAGQATSNFTDGMSVVLD